MRVDLRRMSLRDLAQLLRDVAREVESRERRHGGAPGGGPGGGGPGRPGPHGGGGYPQSGGSFFGQTGGGQPHGGGFGGRPQQGGFQRGGFRRRHQGGHGYTPREAPLPEPREPGPAPDSPHDSAGNRDGANEGRFGG